MDLTPEPKVAKRPDGPPKTPQMETPQNGKVPIPILAARSVEAKTSLKQAELERKFNEELAWYKKRVDHLSGELDIARGKRKDLEAELEDIKTRTEAQLKEAREEAEDLKNRGGERGPRAELEAARREVESLRIERASLQARLADSSHASTAFTRQQLEVKERAAAAERAVAAAEKSLAELNAERASWTNQADAASLTEQLGTASAEVASLRAAGVSATTLNNLRAALSRSQRELTDLQTEYSRAVYEMAKAKAEHSEMAGRLNKAKLELSVSAQRLTEARMTYAEVLMAAQLALDA
ncbi:predicted protein, partial [Haematococcus lacustris]